MEREELYVGEKIESVGPAGRGGGIKYMEGRRVRFNRDEEIGHI